MRSNRESVFGRKKTNYTGWRLKYPGEGGNFNPTGMPAVTPALQMSAQGWQKYITPVLFTQTLQRLAWDIMQAYNPAADTSRFTQAYDTGIALCNNNGFGDPNDPRVNYITGENKGAELPKLMDGIIMAGRLYPGVIEGDVLVQYPGYHAVDANNPVDWQTTIENGWMIRLVSWHDKNGGYGEDFFPKYGGQFWAPHVISEKATYPMEYFDWWDRDYTPDPLKVYL